MLKIRQIKYSKGSCSVQVYKIKNRKRIIVRHIGTARTAEDLSRLLSLATDFIDKSSKQLRMFEDRYSNIGLALSDLEFIGVYYSFFYDTMHKILLDIGFDKLQQAFLLDLAVIRIFEPSSKLRSIELLEEYFGIKHRRQKFYDLAPGWLELKDKAERIAVDFAQSEYQFDYHLVFYDVTTLYFESFQEDGFRKNGFSKDNKSQQPQILVALMVSKEGLPVSYEVFEGNIFEGHTFIPSIERFIKKNQVKTLTVIADAAMISAENSHALQSSGLNYIVGARLANLPQSLLDEISQKLGIEDGNTIRIKTDNGDLICGFSSLRFRKDKHEMQKQIQRAELLINNPGKRKKYKFTKSVGESLALNEKLITKATKLLGVKGYYTNLPEKEVSDKMIIERYSELYRIEQAFRMAKSDLQTRPIFHFKEEPIKLHLLICFIALFTSKHIELKTGSSIKNFLHEAKKITDARLKSNSTAKVYIKRALLNPKIEGLLEKLNLLT